MACNNGGTCIDDINKRICHCDIGWVGDSCDKLYNVCDEEQPCGNGECEFILPQSFICHSCEGDYTTGPLCDQIQFELAVTLVVGADHILQNGSFLNTNISEAFSEATEAYDPDGKILNVTVRGFSNETFLDIIIDYQTTWEEFAAYDDIRSIIILSINDESQLLHTFGVVDFLLTDVDACSRGPCQNNQTCHNTQYDFDCECEGPFSGTFCEEIDVCYGEPCSGRGLCIPDEDEDDGYHCLCGNGEIEEELYNGKDCEERCVYVILTFANGTERTTDINATSYPEPSTLPPSEYEQFSAFVNANGSSPWQDILEFLLNTVRWDEDEDLETVDGPKMIKGRGCLPLPPGELDIPQDVIESLAFLFNFYAGNLSDLGIKSLAVDGEDSCEPNPCENGGLCSGNLFDGSFFCDCPEGFDGAYCEMEIDDCEFEPCANGGICLDLGRDFNCTCPPGYTGYNCETEIDLCLSQPCLNGGLCRQNESSIICDCAAGYGEEFCDLQDDACMTDPCENGGVCMNFGFYYKCNCSAATAIGATCNDTKDVCSSDKCGNNGTCMNDTGSCSCTPGWTGDYCQDSVDDCVAVGACGEPISPCLNGGVCIDGHQEYRCACPPGTYGTTCQEVVDECEDVWCRNDGECVDLEGFNTYECQCSEGWTGPFCQEEIDYCDPDPCGNGSLCNSFDGDYECTCPFGWTGKNCSEEVYPCEEEENPCEHGGLCNHTGPGNFSCTCRGEFVGATCEVGLYYLDVELLIDISYDDAFNNADSEGFAELKSNLTEALAATFENIGSGDKFCGLEISNAAPGLTLNTNVSATLCYSATDDEYHPVVDLKSVFGSIMNVYPVSASILPESDLCERLACSDGATCHDFYYGAFCECPPHLTGDRCQDELCDVYNFCPGDSNCTFENGYQECICPPGHFGYLCEQVSATIEIDINVYGECARSGMTDTTFDELVSNYAGSPLGNNSVSSIGNLTYVSAIRLNGTAYTFTVEFEVFTTIYLLDYLEAFARPFDPEIDLLAIFIYDSQFRQLWDVDYCQSRIGNERGVELCDDGFYGFLPEERCTGTVECLLSASDELECPPNDAVEIEAGECVTITSPGYPSSADQNLVWITTLTAPADHFIEVIIDSELISLRPQDILYLGEGEYPPSDLENMSWDLRQDAMPGGPLTINTFSRQAIIAYLSVEAWIEPESILEGSNATWSLTARAKPVLSVHYDIDIFSSQLVNVPPGSGSYLPGYTYVVTASTLPGFTLVLCSDFSNTAIEMGDVAIFGLTTNVSSSNVQGTYDTAEPENPDEAIGEGMFLILDADPYTVDSRVPQRYSGQVFAIPDGASLEGVCPERFEGNCVINPCAPGDCDDVGCNCTAGPNLCQESPVIRYSVDEADNLVLTRGFPYQRNMYELVIVSSSEFVGFEVKINHTETNLYPGDVIMIGSGTSVSAPSVLMAYSSAMDIAGSISWDGTDIYILFITSPDSGGDSEVYGYSLTIDIHRD